MKSLPAEARSRKRQKPAEVKVATIAHNLEAKPRTEDVKLSEEDKNKDFSSLMLSDPVLKGLKDSGFLKPSPIQLAAIPNAKIGLDMIVQSKSGTGKTCVYVVTALEMLMRELPGLQVLVLAPTREIAMQGLEVANQISSSMPGLKISSFIGGLPLAEDKIKAASCQMAIGTPGRLKQLLTEKALNPDTIRLVILDEADKLLEQSFLADTTCLLNMLPSSKQVMALSATYPDELAMMAEKFMRSPQHIRLAQASQVLHGVAQFCLNLEFSPSQTKQNQIKQAALLKLLSTVPYNQCLIFSNYQILAQSTADFLNSRGFPSICISAGQDQLRRLQAIQSFKTFKCRILCSTDLTARGIDAENVNLVINYDIPEDHNTYLHRIGRGGRFGSASIAMSLLPQGKEEKRLRKVVALTGSQIKVLPQDTIPKNIRDLELPLLEGSLPDVDTSSPSKDQEGKVQDKDDQQSEANYEKKKSGKIKRRGKKKPNSGDKGDVLSVSSTESTRKSVDEPLAIINESHEVEDDVNRDAIKEILLRSQNSTRKIDTFAELKEIANQSKSMILDPNFNSITEVQKVVEKLDKNGNDKSNFNEMLANARNHLEYRTVREILDFVGSNKSLPDRFQGLSIEDRSEDVKDEEIIEDESDEESSANASEEGHVSEDQSEDENEVATNSDDSAESSEEESESEGSDEESSSSDSDTETSPQQYYQQVMMNQFIQQRILQQQQLMRQQQMFQQQLLQQQQQQQQLLQASGGYSQEQLTQWYSNVAAQSRQIQEQAYLANLQNLQQNFKKK